MSPFIRRRSFTLVELLVIMAIFAVLAGAILVTVSGAESQARQAKTKELIARLDGIVMQRWASYATRRAQITTTNMSPKDAAKARLDAIHDLMRMELPERFSDIQDGPVTTVARPAVSASYQGALPGTKTNAFQGAKCLYLIVSIWGLEDGQAMDFFRETDVDDVSQDGMKEFVDAWGNPIRFLRWAPAFLPPFSELQTGDAVNDHDPLDSRKAYPAAYRLTPLIYSAGPDGIYDIVSDIGDETQSGLKYSTINNNPFDVKVKDVIGKPQDLDGNGKIDADDNLHNHYIVID